MKPLIAYAVIGRSADFIYIDSMKELGRPVPSYIDNLIRKKDESIMPNLLRIVTHDMTTIVVYNIVSYKHYTPLKLQEIEYNG